MGKSGHTPKTLALEIVGWLLVAIGLAALVLPGPGLLALFAGMTILATRYEWAERRLEPVREAALKAAKDGVADWPHIIMSTCGVLAILSFGILWTVQPTAPEWWPVAEKFWLIGGSGAGITLIASSIIAGAMLVVSSIKFRPRTAKK